MDKAFSPPNWLPLLDQGLGSENTIASRPVLSVCNAFPFKTARSCNSTLLFHRRSVRDYRKRNVAIDWRTQLHWTSENRPACCGANRGLGVHQRRHRTVNGESRRHFANMGYRHSSDRGWRFCLDCKAVHHSARSNYRIRGRNWSWGRRLERCYRQHDCCRQPGSPNSTKQKRNAGIFSRGARRLISRVDKQVKRTEGATTGG